MPLETFMKQAVVPGGTGAVVIHFPPSCFRVAAASIHWRFEVSPVPVVEMSVAESKGLVELKTAVSVPPSIFVDSGTHQGVPSCRTDLAKA